MERLTVERISRPRHAGRKRASEREREKAKNETENHIAIFHTGSFIYIYKTIYQFDTMNNQNRSLEL